MSVSSRVDHIQIARVIGIPIYLHFSWLIIFGLIVWTLSTGYFPAQYPDLPASSYWAKGLVASLLFFVSILLHELGHAVVARRHGLGTRSITLFIKDASAASYQQVRLDETLRGVTVRDAMVEAVATVPSTGSVAEAARELFLRTGYGGYPVTRGAAVVGLLTTNGVLRCLKVREELRG